jgi:predicted metal-binding membrane protein
MTIAHTPLPRPRRLSVSLLMLRHPELGAAAVVIAAWVTLLVLAARGAHGSSSPAGMAGMSMGGPAAPRSAWSQAAAGLPWWVLMTVAMMGPAALGAIHYTGLESLRWRRRRAMAEFSAAYLAVWAAFGLLAPAAAAVVPGAHGPAALAVVLTAAAAWQLSPVKRRCLSGCHRSVSLPPRGWAAEKGALRFGLRNGLYCVGTCWCLMLLMAVAPAGQLLWAGGLTGVVTGERLTRRPRSATRAGAAALGFAAMATLAIGNLLR